MWLTVKMIVLPGFSIQELALLPCWYNLNCWHFLFTRCKLAILFIHAMSNALKLFYPPNALNTCIVCKMPDRDSVCIRYTSLLWQLRVWWRRQVKRKGVTRKCFLKFLLTPAHQASFALFPKFQVRPRLFCDPWFLYVFGDTGVQYSCSDKTL